MKNSNVKSSAKSSNNDSSRSTKKVIGKVKSSTQKVVTHTQSIVKGKKFCSCQGFKYNGHCTHLPGIENSKLSIQKVAVVKGKTTRAAMINTLVKNIGKVVSLKSILDAAKRVKGVEVSEKKVAKRIPEVAHYAKTRGLKFVKANNGFKFQTA